MSEKRDFEPVEDPREADKMIWEAAKTLASTFVWTSEGPGLSQDAAPKIQLSTHVQQAFPDQRVFIVWIPADLPPQSLVNALAESAAPHCLFSVSLARANIFFKARYKTFDGAGFHFSYPEQIFKVQRRKDMRTAVPDGYVLRAEFPHPEHPKKILSKKVLDISASGMAIVGDEGEQDLFAVGAVLQDVTFTLKGRKIIVPEAEVRHSKSLSKDARMPGYKIGLLFKQIKAADSQAIAQYVFEESRRYFARFMG